jgi:hypothetical protein
MRSATPFEFDIDKPRLLDLFCAQVADAEHAAEVWPSLFGTGMADLPVMQIPSVIAAAMGLPRAKIACGKERISRADSTLIAVSSPAAKYSPFSFF